MGRTIHTIHRTIRPAVGCIQPHLDLFVLLGCDHDLFPLLLEDPGTFLATIGYGGPPKGHRPKLNIDPLSNHQHVGGTRHSTVADLIGQRTALGWLFRSHHFNYGKPRLGNRRVLNFLICITNDMPWHRQS